jgi:uncharacterized protein
MDEPLPKFRFHPDPLATGSVKASKKKCVCCNRSRGHIYVGPVYSEKKYSECICPWCIADGSAHRKLAVSFHDDAEVGGNEWDSVPRQSIDEVVFRTPGFSGWQQERWWSHCGDAAQFIGRAGSEELRELGPQAVQAIRDSTGLTDDTEWNEFFRAIDKDGSPTAYLFKCQKCGQYGGYQDCD